MLDAAVARLYQAALGRLSIKSGLYQLSWLCALMMPICFFAAYAFRDYDHAIVIGLLMLGGSPLVVTLLIAIGYSILSPDRLQSEDFQLRQHSLHLLQGKKRHEVVDAEAVIAIANPVLAAQELPPADEGAAE